MTNSEFDIQKAIAERNYTASMQLFEHAMKKGNISELVREIEQIEEEAPLLTLELRDHIFYFLRMWSIYFAVQIPSIDVLKLLDDNSISKNAPVFMIEFIRNLLDRKDSRFSQFCVNIDTISSDHYAILLPSILHQRIEELEKCKIQFLEGPIQLYCTSDLFDTYYGQKIVAAIHEQKSFDIVINESQFTLIKESLDSAGFDVTSMLERVNSDLWDDFLKSKRKLRIQHGSLGELSVLHRVKSARSNIFAKNFQQQVTAMNAINLSRTQLCNDVLMSVSSDRNHQMRRRALNQLGESGDSSTIIFLADIMQTDKDQSIRTEAARSYSLLASRSQLTGISHTIPPSSSKSYALDISEVNKLLNAIIAKGMPTTMIDD
ncbi:MAG: HEAT repeat domain-containing protein, partial [Candidatus Thorarchaeota archaeon]|nr:HEAT repeat domain-containing protein [Candidatus Thorarchaeota archaeon]